MKYICKICLGEYNDTCGDGLKYYHACPKLTDKDGNEVERKDKRDENKKELEMLDKREQIT